MIIIYRIFGYCLFPLMLIYLKWRLHKGKEDKDRLVERYGYSNISRPEGKLVWIHAASVGESLSALSVVEAINKSLPSVSILLTTGTISSSVLMKERLPDNVYHQYFPLDVIHWVKRFLNHWRPDLVLWIESEFWPTHLSELRYRNIPSILLNARLSDSSFSKWLKFPYYFRKITSLFDKIYAQSVSDEKKFHDLGVDIASFEGNLKSILKPRLVNKEEKKKLEDSIGKRKIWLAASTHNGEEKIIARAHKDLMKEFPDALCVLIPRHPERSKNIEEMLIKKGISVKRRTVFEFPNDETQVYIANTLGELDLFYDISPVSFVGGSLVPIGGHNIIEAARGNSAVIVGPHTSNFEDIIEEFIKKDACVLVNNKNELVKKLKIMLVDKEKTLKIINNANKVLDERSLLIDRILKTISSSIGIKLENNNENTEVLVSK